MVDYDFDLGIRFRFSNFQFATRRLILYWFTWYQSYVVVTIYYALHYIYHTTHAYLFILCYIIYVYIIYLHTFFQASFVQTLHFLNELLLHNTIVYICQNCICIFDYVKRNYDLLLIEYTLNHVLLRLYLTRFQT